jgi:hypothetical protein
VAGNALPPHPRRLLPPAATGSCDARKWRGFLPCGSSSAIIVNDANRFELRKSSRGGWKVNRASGLGIVAAHFSKFAEKCDEKLPIIKIKFYPYFIDFNQNVEAC